MTNLPASPAEIADDESLAELEQVRLGWLELARAEQTPSRLFDIGYYLGSRDLDSRADYRLLAIGNIRIWATIKSGLRNVQADAWNMMRPPPPADKAGVILVSPKR
jgi:hypothetical protein